MIALSLVAVCTALCILHILLNYNKKARLIKKIPGPKAHFIVGNAPEILVKSTELFKVGRFYAEKFKDIHSFYAYPFATVQVYNPEDIEILTSSMKHSAKSVMYSFLKPWLQDGLLLSKGSKWQQRRKILTPAFHFNILRQFFVTLAENSQRLVEALKEIRGDKVDVQPLLSEYTLNAICETAMGTRLHKDNTNYAKSYKKSIYELGQCIVKRFQNIYLHSDLMFNWSSIATKQKSYLRTLHKFTRKVIEERKQYTDSHDIKFSKHLDADDENEIHITFSKKKGMAMLDLLIAAEKENLIDENGIQEEVDTFMFEGHDTTASGLTFCLMLLANYKNEQNKVVAELHEIFGDSSRPANIEDLSKMKYLECCIKESLRLYPPVFFIGRYLSETVKLSNYTVPADTHCHICIYDLHRREDLYTNALVFDPERFFPENSVDRHPYSYIPFSAGPRNCIGQKFAIMEMKSCISAILRNFEIIPVTREADIEMLSDLVLRNAHPVYMKFVIRNKY